jgi:hypothetical protein
VWHSLELSGLVERILMAWIILVTGIMIEKFFIHLFISQFQREAYLKKLEKNSILHRALTALPADGFVIKKGAAGCVCFRNMGIPHSLMNDRRD